MGNVGKAQIQRNILRWHRGEIPFDSDSAESYMDLMGEVDLQPQLRAAYELRQSGQLDLEDYQIIRSCLEEEYYVEFEPHKGETSADVFNPWSPTVQARTLPEGWGYDQDGKAIRLDGDTSHILPTAEGATKAAKPQASADPVRTKTGRFRSDVAELWYYHAETGMVVRQVFTGQDAIRRARVQAREIQAQWTAQGVRHSVAVVKSRIGDMKGNRHVIMYGADGMVIRPQEIVQWSAQAQAAGIVQRCGERMCQTKMASINLMLAQNKLYAGVNNTSVEYPCVEPNDPKEIVYSIRFQSGETRTTTIVPLSDTLDDSGKVTLTGHRRRAYRLLLEAPCSRSDAAATVKYVTYGSEDEPPKVHIVSRDAALRWADAQDEETEDEVLVELHRAFTDGEIDDEEYVVRKGRRLNQIDPPEPFRRGQVMHQTRTRVDYNSEGRMNWQKASNSNGPGARWVGGMSYLEAQLYNMG